MEKGDGCFGVDLAPHLPLSIGLVPGLALALREVLINQPELPHMCSSHTGSECPPLGRERASERDRKRTETNTEKRRARER